MRVQGSGFRVEGPDIGFRVQGSVKGFMVQMILLWLKVQGLGSRV
jgi:hypothetical protein